MQAPAANENPLPKIDFRVFWINIRYKLFIPLIAGFIIAVTTHVLTTKMIPNQWDATTYVIRHAKNMAKQSAVPYLYLQTDLSTVIETIQLRENLDKVIDELQLDTTPEKLRNAIAIQKGNKSNVIRITVTSGDPEKSMAIADSVSETFLANYGEVQNSAAKKVHDYYQSKLTSTKKALYDSRFQEKVFREQHNLLDYEAQKTNLYKAVSELELRYMDEKIRLSDLVARKKEVESKLGDTDNTTLISEIVRTNENTLAQKLYSELEILRKRYTDSNPKIQHLLHKIAVIEQENARTLSANNGKVVDERKFGYNPVYGELQILKIQLDAEITAAEGNILAYQENIDNIKDQLGKLSRLEEQHFQLKQDIANHQEMIRNISDRLIETALAMESNISDFEILEYAQKPIYPKRSFRKIITIGLAALVVLLLGFLIILREFVDTTLKTSFDIELLDGIAFGAVLPDKEQVSKATFYSQFHLFQSAVRNTASPADCQCVTVASLCEEQGKSFICNEMANQATHQKKRVLYIETKDANEYIPEDAIINTAAREGTHDFRAQSVSDHFDKAYFVMSDQIYLDNYETEAISQFLKLASRDYDLILWETFVPNHHLHLYKSIAQASAANLLIAKSGTIPKAELSRTLNLMKEWEIANVGVLLNQMPRKYIRNAL